MNNYFRKFKVFNSDNFLPFFVPSKCHFKIKMTMSEYFLFSKFSLLINHFLIAVSQPISVPVPILTNLSLSTLTSSLPLYPSLPGKELDVNLCRATYGHSHGRAQVSWFGKGWFPFLLQLHLKLNCDTSNRTIIMQTHCGILWLKEVISRNNSE